MSWSLLVRKADSKSRRVHPFTFNFSDRPGLRCIEQVEKIQNKLTESLQNMINLTHKEDSTLFAKLLMKTTDLRTLNALHSEKTVGKDFMVVHCFGWQ